MYKYRWVVVLHPFAEVIFTILAISLHVGSTDLGKTSDSHMWNESNEKNCPRELWEMLSK